MGNFWGSKIRFVGEQPLHIGPEADTLIVGHVTDGIGASCPSMLPKYFEAPNQLRQHPRTFKMSVETITTISPVTNKPVLSRSGLSAADLELLPKVATEAFLSFRKTTLPERQAIIKKALKLLGDKEDELAKELTEQMGRPIAYTAVEVKTAIKRGEYLLKISEDALKDTPGEAEKGFTRFIRKVPVGPVLVLFAWNVSCSFDRLLYC